MGCVIIGARTKGSASSLGIDGGSEAAWGLCLLQSCWGRSDFVVDLEDVAVGLFRYQLLSLVRFEAKLTLWLLKVSTTLSAPSFVSKMSSAITFGCSEIKRQDITTPPTGVMALSMSAAEVPGERFFAITTYGPASPLIDIDDAGLDTPTMLN